MQGQSESLTNTDAVDNAYEYRFIENCLYSLRNPVGENIRYDRTAGTPICLDTDLSKWLSAHVTGSSCYGNTNLVPEFCRSYIECTGTKVLAVHIAKGSTEIAEWLPGSDGYGIITEKASAAIRKAEEEYHVNHIFFVWLQGESDAIFAHTKSYYKDKLILLSRQLKIDIGIDKFCIIRVGHFTNDERDLEIMSAQDEVCEENADFIMLTRRAAELCGMPEYMHPYIAGHYSARGLELLGAEAGKQLGLFACSI